MKLFALVSAFVLSCCSVAFAQPATPTVTPTCGNENLVDWSWETPENLLFLCEEYTSIPEKISVQGFKWSTLGRFRSGWVDMYNNTGASCLTYLWQDHQYTYCQEQSITGCDPCNITITAPACVLPNITPGNADCQKLNTAYRKYLTSLTWCYQYYYRNICMVNWWRSQVIPPTLSPCLDPGPGPVGPTTWIYCFNKSTWEVDNAPYFLTWPDALEEAERERNKCLDRACSDFKRDVYGTRLCIADTNFDGNVDGTDYTIFMNSFTIADPDVDYFADVNGDGSIDGSDYADFIAGFGSGC